MAQYKVRTGDNWSNIASKYGVDIQTLVRANQGIAGKPQVGTYVYIPTTPKPQGQSVSLFGKTRRPTGPRGVQANAEQGGAASTAYVPNQYAQQWLNQQNKPKPTGLNAIGSAGDSPQVPAYNPLQVTSQSPYSPTTSFVPQSPIQQVINPAFPQGTSPVQSPTQAAQPVQPAQLAQQPTWGPGQVSVTAPISQANNYATSPQYFYGGYNPATQTVNYINNSAPVFQQMAEQVNDLLQQGYMPSIISPQVQYNLGFSDQDLIDGGWLQLPSGGWIPAGGGGYDPELTADPGVTDYPGGGDNPYTTNPYRGRTGYMGQQLYTGRGRTGAASQYLSGIGAVSWRI